MSRKSRLENASNAEIDAALNELESKIERLRVSYERYFSGIDRTAPEFLRKEVVRLLRTLENSFIRNTAQKFRLSACSQKMASYGTYWNRVQRQIEEGTFKRDVQKARRNQEQRAARAAAAADDEDRPDAYELDLELDLDADDFFASLERQFSDSATSGNAFALPEDTVFDRTTGPTELLPSAFDRQNQEQTVRQSFDRQHQAPTAVAPNALDELRRMNAIQDPQPTASTSNEASAENDRQMKLNAMRRRLEERTGRVQPPQAAPQQPTFNREQQGETRKVGNEVPGMPTGGADYEKLRKLRQMKQRLEEQQAAPASRPAQPRVVQRSGAHPAASNPTPPAESVRSTGAHRVIQRRTDTAQPSASNDHAREVYNKLVEAKKRCNESTANLSFEAVQRSMNEQREHLRKTRGARDVDFQVVIKDGKAYLKPETKK